MTQRNGLLWYGNAANFEYDPLNRVTQIEQGGNGWIFARNHYQYDSLGRDVAEWRDEDGGKGERYGYTTTNQLSSAVYMADQVYSGNPLNAQSSSSYTYTPDMLNRSSVNDNGAATNYTANGMNQYTDITGQGIHYDGNFNIWYLNGGYVTYDADKRVTSVSVGGSEWMHFTYDALGRCVRRMEMGTTTLFTYDEWNQMLEWDEWGNFKAWNIYGARADEILARYDTTHGALIYKQDKLGNVVFLLDGSGNLLERYRYDAFGQPKVTDWYGNDHGGASWYGNRFLFTGREYLSWIACYDYRNRMYRPSLGRFLQTDPKGFEAGDMNLFRYCADDPVDRTDPTGLMDRFWAMEKYFDSSSTFKGDYNQWMGNHPQAGMGDNAGGGQSVSAEHGGNKRNGRAQTLALDMLRGEARGTNDTTGEIVLQGGEIRHAKPVEGHYVQNAPFDPAQGHKMAQEHLGTGGRALWIVHYHFRGGNERNPTPDDYQTMKNERAPMMFTSKDLAREGHYQILRSEFIKPQTLFDRQLYLEHHNE
jgi:RHS repeat-associated protein